MINFLEITPEELEFYTEMEPVKVIPNFMYQSIDLISGPVGPFRPNMECQVPIWVAIQLKKSKKCKIIPPGCLSEDYIRDRITEEKNDKDRLSSIEFKFFDLFKIFDK